ncbi:MAG TPA: hypothetical protein VEG39_02975 [Clostridia bacterium]|nr:hypothetical protein [Clostridia bacterium]
MKKSKIFIYLIAAAIIALFALCLSNAGIKEFAGGYLIGRSFINEPEIDKVKFQQTKAQVYLFEQALKEFNAASFMFGLIDYLLEPGQASHNNCIQAKAHEIIIMDMDK